MTKKEKSSSFFYLDGPRVRTTITAGVNAGVTGPPAARARSTQILLLRTTAWTGGTSASSAAGRTTALEAESFSFENSYKEDFKFSLC